MDRSYERREEHFDNLGGNEATATGHSVRWDRSRGDEKGYDPYSWNAKDLKDSSLAPGTHQSTKTMLQMLPMYNTHSHYSGMRTGRCIIPEDISNLFNQELAHFVSILVSNSHLLPFLLSCHLEYSNACVIMPGSKQSNDRQLATRIYSPLLRQQDP